MDSLKNDAADLQNDARTSASHDTPETQARSRRVRRSYIYFIRAGDQIKIGFSTNPGGRLRALQTSHSVRLEIIGTLTGKIQDEARLHRMFARDNIRGEWFRASRALLDYIERFTIEGIERKRVRHQTEMPMGPPPRPTEVSPEFVSLRKALAKRWPKLSKDVQPIASNIMQQIKNLPYNPHLKPLIARQLVELERRMAAV